MSPAHNLPPCCTIKGPLGVWAQLQQFYLHGGKKNEEPNL